MDGVKHLLNQIGDAIDRRAPKDELFALTHEALKMISEREEDFVGHQPTKIN